MLGARGRRSLQGLQLGAVTQQILEHATEPVLIARHG
ncbi:universal stress protein [Dactylosporangium sp. NPDC005555]